MKNPIYFPLHFELNPQNCGLFPLKISKIWERILQKDCGDEIAIGASNYHEAWQSEEALNKFAKQTSL